MIPQGITRSDVQWALRHIDKHGVRKWRHSTRYSIAFRGKLYPPKYAICIANRRTNGREWPNYRFSGGKEANHFLTRLGFRIVPTPSA